MKWLEAQDAFYKLKDAYDVLIATRKLNEILQECYKQKVQNSSNVGVPTEGDKSLSSKITDQGEVKCQKI